ncbi:hypothetical protein ACOMHN_016887 [Nucella lapillus]
MAGWSRYLWILAALVCLKFLEPFPLLQFLSDLVESHIERKADVGCEAVNVKLSFVDRSPCHLYDFLRPYRPLVISFISHVDEPFWSELKKFNEVVKRLSWMADFVTVVVGCGVENSKSYWERMLSKEPACCMNHHYCMHDRKTVASFLVNAGIAGDLLFDPPTNDSLLAYSPTPERLYVIYGTSVVYDSGRGGDHGGYRVDILWHCLWLLYWKKVRPDQKMYASHYEPKTSPFVSKTLENKKHVSAHKSPAKKRPQTAEESLSSSWESGILDGSHIDLTKTAGPSILMKPENNEHGSISMSMQEYRLNDAIQEAEKAELPKCQNEESTSEEFDQQLNSKKNKFLGLIKRTSISPMKSSNPLQTPSSSFQASPLFDKN